MAFLNAKTHEAIESLADAGVTISMTRAARLLGMASSRQLQPAAERGDLPYVVEVTYPGETKRRFRIMTTRFIKYLCGELEEKNVKEG